MNDTVSAHFNSLPRKILSLFILSASDILVVSISLAAAFFLRKIILPQFISGYDQIVLAPFSNFVNKYYMVVVWIFIFALEKLYTKRYPFWEEVKVLLRSASIAWALIMIMIFMARIEVQYSRTIIIAAWLISLVLFPLSRYFLKLLLTRMNLWKKQLFILGVHQTSLQVLNNIRKNKTMGYEVLGFLDDDPRKLGKSFAGVEVIGKLSDLENLTKTYKSKDIIITTPHLPRNKLRELLSNCENVSESMWLIPRSGDFITEGVELELLGDVLSLYIKKNLTKPWNIAIKIFFEKVLTLMMLIIFLPILLCVAAAIKFDSKGPAIYTQKRLGLNQKMFRLFKFRSMFTDGDRQLDRYLETHTEAKNQWNKYKKLKKNDPRVTRVGKFIRKYSLDELPQLINVIQGNMSLVGPRPYLPAELEGKDAFKSNIARVRPGITGLWQVSGRSELPFSKRIALDEYYIRNWSLWLDITILLKSLRVWFSNVGAY